VMPRGEFEKALQKVLSPVVLAVAFARATVFILFSF
jgi:hypothetical protein